jgi:hypothetical protein
MPRAEFEPTIPVFERSKIDGVAIGRGYTVPILFYYLIPSQIHANRTPKTKNTAIHDTKKHDQMIQRRSYFMQTDATAAGSTEEVFR